MKGWLRDILVRCTVLIIITCICHYYCTYVLTVSPFPFTEFSKKQNEFLLNVTRSKVIILLLICQVWLVITLSSLCTETKYLLVRNVVWLQHEAMNRFNSLDTQYNMLKVSVTVVYRRFHMLLLLDAMTFYSMSSKGNGLIVCQVVTLP